MLPQIAAIFIATYFLSYFGLGFLVPVRVTSISTPIFVLSGSYRSRLILSCVAGLVYVLWVS